MGCYTLHSANYCNLLQVFGQHKLDSGITLDFDKLNNRLTIVEKYMDDQVENTESKAVKFISLLALETNVITTVSRIINGARSSVKNELAYEILKFLMSKPILPSVCKKTVEQIGEKNELDLLGFSTFQLKYITNEIISLLDAVLHKQYAELQYLNFISLMQDYVKSSKSNKNAATIHVFFNQSGFMLFDKSYSNITHKAFSADSDQELNSNELLISFLLEQMPEKIIVHKAKSIEMPNIVHTINQIFSNRVCISNDVDFFISGKGC